MSYSSDAETVQAIKQSLQQLAIQLEQPHDRITIVRLYESAQELTNHLSPDPLTLARVAGILLVYQTPGIDRNEVRWFESELKNCPDVESVEELIDSLSRSDSL